MGRNGMGVVFEPADASHPTDFQAHRRDVLASLVDEVVEAEHRIGIAMARRAEAIERARAFSESIAANPATGVATASSQDLARRGFVSEIAAALRLPDRTAEHLIRTSEALVNTLPATLLALGEGRLGWRHAQILVDQSYGLDAATVRELETRMLPVAEKNTPSRFERSVRRTRERLNPETMTTRHEVAVVNRGIELMPEADGMVFVGAHVNAVVGVAIDDRLTTIARTLQGDHEPRTLGQLKADIFADLLLDDSLIGTDGLPWTSAGKGEGAIHRFRNIRPTVLVTVPALTLLGIGHQPGVLEGYGPIDAQTAREIASYAKTLRRLITDPISGVVLVFDRKRYRVPKDLRVWLRVRDGTCRFPGCNRRAGPCDIDHTHDWALGGPTNHDNLAHLCRRHHTLKTAGQWTVRQTGAGKLVWTTSTGHHYSTDPENGGA
jgi:hypothetical protein